MKKDPNVSVSPTTENVSTESVSETGAVPRNEGRDQSGQVQPSVDVEIPAITTPKGGGAIAGIGEKFQANAVTGTGSTTVPITLSPGRNGFTPQLALSYDSGSGNSAFGLGWSVGLPSISRKTQKGLPRYEDADDSDIFLLAGAEDLIPVLRSTGGSWAQVTRVEGNYLIKAYRPRVEGLFARIELYMDQQRSTSHWRVTTKDNITSIYGQSRDARIHDPDDVKRIFQWMLEYTFDEKGNITYYAYKKEDGIGVDPAQLNEKNRKKTYPQKYLKGVYYTPDLPFDESNSTYFETVKWRFQLILDYGEHDDTQPSIEETRPWAVRQDAFSSYRSGFEIRTYRLCRRFLMFHFFEADLGAVPYLVKSTDLAYDENIIASRLLSVQHRGYEQGVGSLPYPPVTFAYSEANIDPLIHGFAGEDIENLPYGVDGQRYRWTDLEGEGLPGVLLDDQAAWYYQNNLGDENYYRNHNTPDRPAPEARLAPIKQVLAKPSLGDLQSGRQQISDVDGDGTQDLLINGPQMRGYYAQDTDGQWKTFTPFTSNPNINWDDPNLRLIDLDGDGFADIMITKESCFTCYPSLAQEGYGPSYETLKRFDEEEGPNIIFADVDRTIYLADMSGDGLVDIVQVMNGAVWYWPNLGYGRFGAKVSMDNSPLFDHQDIFDQRRIRLGDIDGSGTADIIYIAEEEVRYYPNGSGNRFEDPILINQRIPTHDLTTVSLIDLLGNGAQCLVWSSPVPGDHPPYLKYIDLMKEGKPYLLTEMNNNMGSITRLKYVPSTKFYLKDKREGNPWITKLPFPVQVVERVEVWDGINRNRFVTRYAYHHGYYDGVEREFRGFGRVEQWDTETFADFTSEGLFPPGFNSGEEVLHVPPVYTKTWFHTGYYEEGTQILGQCAEEYYSGDASALSIVRDIPGFIPGSRSSPQDFRGSGSSPETTAIREAARALKGSSLRQEVYSQDGSAAAEHPYVVTENNYVLKQVQPRGPKDRRDQDYASFLVTPGETLSYQYERNPNDPRVSHQLVLETDDYGHVLKSAAVGYGRRANASIGFDEQDRGLITISENTVVNVDDNPEFYRLGVPVESKTYELTGLRDSGSSPGMGNNLPGPVPGFPLVTIEEIQDALRNGTKVPFQPAPIQAPIGYLDFNGTNNYVAIRDLNYNSFNSIPVMTAEAWVRTSYVGGGYNGNWAILDFDRSDYFNFYVRGDNGRVGFSTYGGSNPIHDMTGNQVVNDGQWHHLAVVYDGTDKIIYVDGQEDARILNPHSGSGLGRNRTRFGIIGDGSEAASFDGSRNNIYFEGQLTEIRYWEAARTPQEINDFHAQRLTGSETGLTLYYDMTEGSGGLLTDRTGNGYNGELRNMTTPWNTDGPLFEAGGSAPATGPVQRLIDQSRVLYYQEDLNPSTPLPFGQIASHGLPFRAYQLAVTQELLAAVINDDFNRADPTLMTEGGYVDLLSDGNYWMVSNQVTFDAARFYLPTAQADPFGQQSTIVYDSYDLTVFQTQDALNNIAEANHDFRVLQTRLLTDPNGNRQEFAFDERGMATAMGVMGKASESNGDTITDPTMTFSYDLFRWMNEGLPNFAYVRARREHANPGTLWEESYAYSDGLGQVVMTKTLASSGDAFVRDANGELQRDGNGDLQLANANPRWIGSGRVVLDNKGNPVKQYEPYYSSISEYEWEAELVEYGVTPIIRYDPLGRAIRTDLPDDTFTKVEFDPWQQANFDQNDTVLESFWYMTRNSPDPAGPEPSPADERAAWLAAQHANTPQLVRMDSLGRPFLTIDDNAAAGQYQVRNTLDIKGNTTLVLDAKGRDAFGYSYDMVNQVLQTDHLDNGKRYSLISVTGNPLRAWDSRSRQYRFSYDELQRPTHTYVLPDYDQASPGPEKLTALTVYGEGLVDPTEFNHRGRVFLSFDGAGMICYERYNFKNLLWREARQLALQYDDTPDWISLDGISVPGTVKSNAQALLETELLTQLYFYDAVNRLNRQRPPNDNEIIYNFHEEGTIDRVFHNTGTTVGIITGTEYNARGQRERINYGNGTQTAYTYDEKTFRLVQLRSTRNGGSEVVQELTYTYDAVGNIVEMEDSAQQTVFFNNAQVNPIRKYRYDALYRLLSAEGREFVNNNVAPGPGDIAMNPLPDTNTTALRNYTQSYAYDELGNIEQMSHSAVGGSWNRYYHYNDPFSNNQLLSTSPDNVQPTSDQYTYDAHGNMTSMPHLASMVWDEGDRLQSADLGGGGNVYYQYDAGGERIRKVIINGNIRDERIYQGGVWEIYRKTVNSVLDTERSSVHISDDTGRVCMIDSLLVDGGSVVSSPTLQYRYLLSNHLGSSSIELDETAALISYEEYYPFGSSSYRSGRNAAEASLKRYRYVDKERDDETGLYYYGARYYASWLARFVSVDPLKDDYPQLASYQYAGNDPVGDIDIDGLEGTKTKKLLTVKSATTNIEPLRNRKLDIQLFQQQRQEKQQQLKQLLSGEGLDPRNDPNATFLSPAPNKSEAQRKKELRQFEFKQNMQRLKKGQLATQGPAAFQLSESPVIKGVATGVILSPIVQPLISREAVAAGAKQIGKDFGVGVLANLTGQTLGIAFDSNKGFEDIDVADALSSGVTTAVTKKFLINVTVDATISSTVDLTFKEGLKTPFNGTKGELDVAYDFGAGIILGGIGNLSDDVIDSNKARALLKGAKPLVKQGLKEGVKLVEGVVVDKSKEKIKNENNKKKEN